MRRFTPVLLPISLAFALALSACASRAPAPIVVAAPSGTSEPPSPPVPVSPAIQPIGQCNPGTPSAAISYPAEWDARLTAARKARAGEDELLGAPRPRPGDGPARALNIPAAPFPEGVRELGLQAACEVLLSVDVEGKPIDPLAACSSPLFLVAARDTASALRFSPKVEGGRPVASEGVVQPVLFCQ